MSWAIVDTRSGFRFVRNGHPQSPKARSAALSSLVGPVSLSTLSILDTRVFRRYTTRVAASKQSKLTLVVNPSVVRRAKSYASAHGTSVSSLVESYLKNLTAAEGNDMSSDPDSWPPTTRSLYGALTGIEGVDTDELKRRYLHDKYLHD